MVSATTRDGAPVMLVYVAASATRGWHLPDAVRQGLTQDGAVAVLTSEGSIGARQLEDAARAFGLSGLETRVAIATIETGSIRAAALLDVAYQTAREAIAGAKRRAGLTRLPALVTLLAEVGFGVLPEGEDDAALMADVWGITLRQATIGVLVAGGLERGAAGAALGLSDAVTKKGIDRLYEALGVSTDAALARVIAEANAMQWIMRATEDGVGMFDSRLEPLALRCALMAAGWHGATMSGEWPAGADRA